MIRHALHGLLRPARGRTRGTQIRRSSSHQNSHIGLNAKVELSEVENPSVSFGDVTRVMTLIGGVSGGLTGLSYGLFYGGHLYDHDHWRKLQRRERIVDRTVSAIFYGFGGIFAGALCGATSFLTCPLIGLAYYIDKKQHEV